MTISGPAADSNLMVPDADELAEFGGIEASPDDEEGEDVPHVYAIEVWVPDGRGNIIGSMFIGPFGEDDVQTFFDTHYDQQRARVVVIIDAQFLLERDELPPPQVQLIHVPSTEQIQKLEVPGR